MKVILYIMIGLSVLHAQYIRDNTKEVVLDTTTQLIWQDNNDSKTIYKGWINAIEYCESLELGGESDWRLPNSKELSSLTVKSKYNPSISSEFVNIISDQYWSSTTLVSLPSNAWYVDFKYGMVKSFGYRRYKGNGNYVRCVR